MGASEGAVVRLGCPDGREPGDTSLRKVQAAITNRDDSRFTDERSQLACDALA
jgi:hypothetical protein